MLWSVNLEEDKNATYEIRSKMNRQSVSGSRSLQVSGVKLKLSGWLETVGAAFTWSRAVGIFILQLTLNTTGRNWIVSHFAARECVTEVEPLKSVITIPLKLWWAWLQITAPSKGLKHSKQLSVII